MRSPISLFINWYIKRNYSRDFLHRDSIADEIKLRLREQEKRLRREHAQDLDDMRHELALEYHIKEEGYVADIQRLEERDKRRDAQHKKTMELYYRVKRWAQQLAIVTATNQQRGNEIQENISEYIGKLDKVEIDAHKITKEISDREREDKGILSASGKDGKK